MSHPLVAGLLAAALAAGAHAFAVEGAGTPEALAEEITACLASPGYAQTLAAGTVAVLVEQRDPARVIFDRGGDRPMIPASCNKLQTTAAALHFLGADHRRTTRLLANGPVDENGCLRGDLIVVGDGDPVVGGRWASEEAVAILEEWTRRLRTEHGIRSVAGRVIGDDDLFDDQAIVDSWFMDELGEYYEAEVGALTLNDNCVDLLWIAGPAIGTPARWRLRPPTRYLQIVSQVTTVSPEADTDRYYHRAQTSNRTEVTGGIRLGETAEDHASVHNPTLHFAQILRETLMRGGITVLGEAADLDDLDRAAVRHDLRELLARESLPLIRVIDLTNQWSVNLYAEMLLKLVGAEVEGEGSFEAGIRAVRHFMGEIGALPASPEAWRMVDGSGLSPLNRVPPRTLVDLLRHMDTRPDAEAWRATLNRGRDSRGHLRHRFAWSDRHRAVGPQVLGKPGYIDGVWNLAGIIRNQAGAELYCAVMVNSRAATGRLAHHLIDDIFAAVAASTFE